MKLYGYWRSSSSWRVRIGLAIKGVDYEYVPVHLVRDGGEQHREDFVEKSPLGQIPVLEWEEEGTTFEVTQSLAILEYLEERYPEPSLLPGGPEQRARIRQLAEIINSGTQPLQNLSVIKKLRDELGVDPKPWCGEFIEKGLRAYEALVEERATFSIGEVPTLADLCLVPQLYNARRFGVDLEPMKRLLEIEAACESLDAFQVAAPDRQIDAQ